MINSNLFDLSRKKFFLTCSLFLFVSFFSFEAKAQQPTQPDKDHRYWIHGGPALTTLGVGYHGGITFDYNRHVFSARGLSSDTAPANEFWDIALLYGRSMNFESIYLSAAVGTSVIGGKGYSDLFGAGTPQNIETTLGFPLEGQVAWEPTRFLSLAVYTFMNVNTEQPLAGAALSVRIGNF